MAAAVDFIQPVFLMCLQSLCNVAEANQQKWLKGKVKPWPRSTAVCLFHRTPVGGMRTRPEPSSLESTSTLR